MRVIVIGSGVVGSGLAWRLASQEQETLLIERGRPASGTTGSSFSWYNANSKRPEDYFRLNLAGMAAHITLREELGAAPWYHEGGNLVWSADGDWMDSGEIEDNLEARVAELQGWDYPAEWIPVAEASDT